MNGFEVTHPWNPTDNTDLLVYNTSIDTKNFTFQLPGWCAQEWFTTLLLANSPSHWSTAHLSCITLTLTVD